MEKTRSITGRHGSMLYFRQVISPVAPMSDRRHRLSIAQMSRFPWL